MLTVTHWRLIKAAQQGAKFVPTTGNPLFIYPSVIPLM